MTDAKIGRSMKKRENTLFVSKPTLAGWVHVPASRPGPDKVYYSFAGEFSIIWSKFGGDEIQKVWQM